MDNLLDTHTLIWFINGDDAVSAKARQQIEDNIDSNYVSIASLWEMAIKIRLEKLEMNCSFKELSALLNANAFKILPISFEDTLTISLLPFHHRDPFDRMLVAQAKNNGLKILSKDSVFEQYELDVVW